MGLGQLRQQRQAPADPTGVYAQGDGRLIPSAKATDNIPMQVQSRAVAGKGVHGPDPNFSHPARTIESLFAIPRQSV